MNDGMVNEGCAIEASETAVFAMDYKARLLRMFPHCAESNRMRRAERALEDFRTFYDDLDTVSAYWAARDAIKQLDGIFAPLGA